MKVDHSETLHRLVKMLIDNGAAQSIEEANAIFDSFKLSVEITASGAAGVAGQAAFLTAIVTGRRVFLGGVEVSGKLDQPLLLPLHLGATLSDAAAALGAVVVGKISETPPLIIIGHGGKVPGGFCVRALSAGWRGGIVPGNSDLSPVGKPAMPLAGMISASIAVNEAFLFVNGEMPAAGHRTVGMSLWRPTELDWLSPDDTEPELTYLPSRAWFIGLGHLGQANLWAFGLLPYANPKEVHFVLQDVDTISPSTESTSILSNQGLVGVKKTRAMAAWAEERGFQCSIVERLFDGKFQRQDDEPALAFCGLDNALGRRALDLVGFDMVIEAGLGRGHRDFRTMRLHTLPGQRPAAEIWRSAGNSENVESRPAYRRLLERGEVDRCGMTLLAGKAVGAPFVGVTAAGLAVAEALRQLHGGALHQLIDLDLQCLDERGAVVHPQDFSSTNFGYTLGCS